MRRQGFFWLKNWGFFTDPDKYVSAFLESRGQDDKIVSDEIVRILRGERWRRAVLRPMWFVHSVRYRCWQLWVKWQAPKTSQAIVAESIGEKLAIDPLAAGFTPEGVQALTEGKKGCSA